MQAVQVLETVGMFLLVVSVVTATIRQYAWPERFQLLNVTAGALTMVSGFMILLGTIIFGTESKAELHGILINNVKIEQYTLQAGFYLSITAGILSVVTGILFCAFRIDKQVPGLRQSHAVSVVRPADTGLYKARLHRQTFKSFQPNMPSRYNYM